MKSAMRKAAPWLFMLIIVLMGLFVVYKIRQRKSASYWAEAWNSNMVNKYDSLPLDSGDVVFAGNSLTFDFPFKEILPGVVVRNRGIPYNQTHHLLARLQRLLDRKPGKLFLEIGINDIIGKVNNDTILENFKRIIERCKTSGSTIYIQSIFPTTHGYRRLLPAIKDINTHVRSYCALMNVMFLDVYTALLKDGELDQSLTTDGLHLNAKGYQVWADVVLPYIKMQ